MTAVRVRRIFSPLTCRWVTYLTDYICVCVCPSAYNTKHPDAIPAWEKNWEGT